MADSGGVWTKIYPDAEPTVVEVEYLVVAGGGGGGGILNQGSYPGGGGGAGGLLTGTLNVTKGNPNTVLVGAKL